MLLIDNDFEVIWDLREYSQRPLKYRVELNNPDKIINILLIIGL